MSVLVRGLQKVCCEKARGGDKMAEFGKENEICCLERRKECERIWNGAYECACV